MSRKNLIRGALLLILGGAFLFALADITGANHPHFDAHHIHHDIRNPKPHCQNELVLYLPFLKDIGGFLAFEAKRGMPRFFFRRA